MRVLSPGNDGNVTQSNTVASKATAANINLTGQNAGQAQGGSGGTQAIGQDADNDQSATALSAAKQDGATNRNIPVRVLSDGYGGDVTQTNSVDSSASAGNLNATKQYADQDQGGKDKCCASGGTQAIGQDADSKQKAGALSVALQSGASNTNTPVRVGSKGADGDVSQTNSVESKATALNVNLTGQKADQEQAGDCKCAGGGTQAIGQKAKNDQSAGAASLAAQSFGRDKCGCGSSGNTNTPVRVDSYGGGGSVEQSNSVASSAGAGNLNGLYQGAGQGQSGSGGTQAIGQEAKNEQDALAASAALQSGASNTNTPVRVDSKGDDGDVAQSNSVASPATALNANLTKQDADQAQRGSCGCGSEGIQAIGQSAKNEQAAIGLSAALQSGASNRNSPVVVRGKDRMDRKDHRKADGYKDDRKADPKADGRERPDRRRGRLAVEQRRVEGDGAEHQPDQAGRRPESGRPQQQGVRLPCGTGIQAIGQEAKNEQGALAGSLAIQAFGRDKCGCPSGGNSNTPVGVGSYGSGGSVDQSNAARSSALAPNLNALYQGADQAQSGGGGTQAIGQSAKNHQLAIGLSAALQLGPQNAIGRSHAI